jgi:hypothetical protein
MVEEDPIVFLDAAMRMCKLEAVGRRGVTQRLLEEKTY